MRQGLTCVVVLVFGLAAGGTAGAQDIIRLKSGEEVRGKVTALTPLGLTYTDAGGKSVKLNNEEFVEFILGDTPAGLRQGDLSANARDYDKAIAGYQGALKELEKHPRGDLHKQFVYYKMSVAYREKGDVDGALGALQELRKKCPACRLRGDSFHDSLELARKKQDKQPVKDILEEMKREPEPLAGQADLELAKLMYDKGEFAPAQDVFYRLSNNANQPYASDAKMWSIRCLRALKKTEGLEKLCASVLANRASAGLSLVQAASVSLGDILLEKAEKDKTKVWEALQAYARAISVGPPKDDSPEDYARAVLNAGKCWQLMSRESAKQEVKDEYKNRAIGYFTEVSRSYPDTDWGRQGKDFLGRLAPGGAPKEEKKEQ